MKEFSPQEIQGAKSYFEGQQFPVTSSQLGDFSTRFYTLPQALEPRLPDFAFRMTGPSEEGVTEGIYGVSESVPEPLRPWWALHELVEFELLGIDAKDRCARAEATVLQSITPELRADYIIRRTDFFKNLIEYFHKNQGPYTEADIEEAMETLKYLGQEDKYLIKLVAESDQTPVLFIHAADLCINMVKRLAADGLLPQDDSPMILEAMMPEVVANSVESIGKRVEQEPDIEPEVTIHAFQTPTHTVFQILDNGTGFPPELLDKVGKTIIVSDKKDEVSKQFRLGGAGSFLYTAGIFCKQKGWDLQIGNRTTSPGAIISISVPRTDRNTS